MSQELGRLDRPSALQFVGKKKLLLLPLIQAPNADELEVKEILDRYPGTRNSKEIEQVLTRGEIVRFSPISSRNAQSDMLKIKALLRQIDDDWT